MIKPLGYQVLVKMEEIEQTVKEGALAGFVLTSDEENKREQVGHDLGVVVAFGPLAYTGWEGVQGVTPDERAECWGVKVGDKVEFHRYDGKIPAGHKDHRLVPDKELIGVIE